MPPNTQAEGRPIHQPRPASPFGYAAQPMYTNASHPKHIAYNSTTFCFNNGAVSAEEQAFKTAGKAVLFQSVQVFPGVITPGGFPVYGVYEIFFDDSPSSIQFDTRSPTVDASLTPIFYQPEKFINGFSFWKIRVKEITGQRCALRIVAFNEPLGHIAQENKCCMANRAEVAAYGTGANGATGNLGGGSGGGGGGVASSPAPVPA